MSSRTLRKLQREQEQQKQLSLANSEHAEESDDSEPDSAPQRNAFDFLNETEEDNDKGDKSDQEDIEDYETAQESDAAQASISKQTLNPRKSKKKGKKKKKSGKGKESATQDALLPKGDGTPLDEIDLALIKLKVQCAESPQTAEANAIQAELQIFYNLLSTDTRNLNSLNEMKKLFGSTVLEGENEGEVAGGRRRGRGAQQLDLGRALAGRNNPASRGQGLAGLALRRNVFMLGKEEWPKATSGGLSMEVVEKAWDFTTEYRFVHNPVYQDVQRQFDNCVESMDPQRLIQLLQSNPYHISTLLQVSEIAKQQGDHSVAADLLERALFTFGRSAHSTFHNAMNEGKIRLDFRRPENREFWLAAWRYIGSLGQRGTWRTAYEWAKLLLSLDPEEDPYCVRLIIDQLAIRGCQFENFINLVKTDPATVDWGQTSPNIQVSLAMAAFRLKRTDEARELLSTAIRRFPWIFARLFRELGINPIPKEIWGKEPRNAHEELHTAAYVLRAKDIWNTPETTSFLIDVVKNLEGDSLVTAVSPQAITLNEARHILLSDVPALIGLLPHELTTLRSSSSDPLPPDDQVFSYPEAFEPEDDVGEFPTPRRNRQQNDEQELGGNDSWLRSLLSQLGLDRFTLGGNRANDGNEDADGYEEEQTPEETIRRLQESGAGLVEIAQRTARIDELRRRQMPAEDDLQGREYEELARAIEESQRAFAAETEAATEASGSGAPARGQPQADDEASANAEPAPESTGYDDQANQRWLAGRGMLALKEFVSAHGADEKVWKDDLSVDSRAATEYAFRVMQLKQRSSRNFILDYPLSQGAGAETSAMIKRMIGV